METENEKGSAENFVNQQKSTDNAINRRIKKEQGKSKLDPEETNNPKNRNTESDIASKKTGSGKQKGPGM
ncbi:MAG TPA: hypothetical protein VE467_06585 [Chryseolinea sp.]|jgi:hypothetical protein|nr:hypothetical protein [Chryseolinea sp.]